MQDMAAGDCRKLNTAAPLVTAATLPRLRLVSLYGCTAGSRAAESALSELSYVLRCAACPNPKLHVRLHGPRARR